MLSLLQFNGAFNNHKEVYMRRYETVMIMDSDISDEEKNTVFDRIEDIIPKYGGELFQFDKWGDKKLAYEIKKKKHGYYIYLNFCGDGNTVNEIERLFRIDERVLKYMTVLLKKNVDVEKLRDEINKKEAEEESGNTKNASAVKEKKNVESSDETVENKSDETVENKADETVENKAENSQS